MEVLVPSTLADALDAAAAHPGAALLAGGTDLMVDINFGRARPETIVVVQRLPELRGLERDGRLVLTGPVQSPAERQAAEDVVLAAVPHAKIENEIEVESLVLGGESALESAVDHVEEGRG